MYDYPVLALGNYFDENPITVDTDIFCPDARLSMLVCKGIANMFYNAAENERKKGNEERAFQLEYHAFKTMDEARMRRLKLWDAIKNAGPETEE